MGKSTSNTRFSPRTLLILSSLVSLALTASGIVYYNIEKNRILDQNYLEIASVANLKIRDIERWRLERLADARELAGSPLMDRAIFRWLKSRNDANVRREIEKQLRLEKKLSLYTNAFVVGTSGRTIIAGGKRLPEIGASERTYFQQALKTRRPVLSDIFHGSEGREYIDVMDAIAGSSGRPAAVVVLRSDAANFLFPLLNSWPVPSRTAETILVEKRGNDVVTLNSLRFNQAAPGSTLIPRSSIDNPAVQAALGRVGMFQGKDYRGKSVLADLRAIPGSRWYLVAKVDSSEIFKELRYRAGVVALLVALIIILLISATAYAHRHRQAEVYRELYERESELREIHEEYRATVYSIGDGVITTDMKGCVKQMNPVAEHLTGWSESGAKGNPLDNIFMTVREETGTAAKGEFERVLKEGVVIGSGEPTILISKDGRRYPVSYTIAPIHDDAGKGVGSVLVFQDESAGREAERKLKESEGNYRNLVQMSPDAIVIYQDDKIAFINDPGAKLAGAASPEDLIGKPISEFMNPDSLKESKAREVRLLRGEKVTYPVEDKYVKVDGTIVPVELSAGPTNFGGKIAVQVVIRDVTERIKRERELHESEERFRTLFENSTIGLYRTTPDGRILLSNPALLKMIGYESFEELAARNLEEEGFEPDYARREFIRRIERDGEVIGLESAWTRKDGSVVPVRENARAMRDANGHTLYYDGTAEDITEHRKAERALRESEQKFRALVEGSASAIWIHDGVHFLYANPTAVRLTGYTLDEFTRLDVTDLHLPEERGPLKDRMKRRLDGEDVINHFESRVLRKNGDLVWADLTASLIEYRGSPAIIVSAYDISDRKKLEEQLIQSQKMEGLGRLAGGVAHDYNNILNVVVGYSDLLKRKLPEDDPSRQPLEAILAAARRGADLTRQLLAFARKEIVSPQVVSVNSAIESIMNMLHRIIGENLRLVFIPENGLWNVKIDPTQFDQIVVNLVTNAKDAIDDVGTITIRTFNKKFSNGDVPQGTRLTPGEYVVVEFEDSGRGIDAQTLKRLFEPFFTTKPKGHGTGLGLSTVYGILRQNGGSIEVKSEIGKGSKFTVYVPRFAGAVKSIELLPADESVKGTVTVLVVEDQTDLLNLTRAFLEGCGYNVITAAGPIDAEVLSRSYSGEIHLLLTDIIMPKMSGRELSERISMRRQGLRTLYMSGYGSDNLVEGEKGGNPNDFIQKPFELTELALRIRQVLSQKSHTVSLN